MGPSAALAASCLHRVAVASRAEAIGTVRPVPRPPARRVAALVIEGNVADLGRRPSIHGR
jgi:hypothetical protein